MRLLRTTVIGLAASLVVAATADARPFAPGSVWNTRVDRSAKLAPSSRALTAELQRQVTQHGVWINTTQYSSPVYSVPGDQRRTRITVDDNAAELQRAFGSVPLPADARPARGSDGHLTLVQGDSNRLWEFFKLRRAADGWHARWGARIDSLSRSPGYVARPYGATATGLPLLGGLMRASDLRAGNVPHALAIGIPEVRKGAWVWPAQRGGGLSTHAGALAHGARFRLDPTLDVSALGLPRAARTMAVAAQRYGIVLRDTSGAVTFYAEDPARMATNPYPGLFGKLPPNKLLARFPWQRLQALAP